MEKTKRLVSRKEAAEFLNCSQQTVSNWVNDGILKGHNIDGRLFVDANTLDAIVDNVNDIENSKTKIAELRNQLDEERKKLENELTSKREELLLCKSVLGGITRSTVSSLVSTYKSLLAESEVDVIKSVLCCGNIEDVAKKYEIDGTHVLRIFEKGCKRLRYVNFDKMNEELSFFKQRVNELENENQNLRNGIAVSTNNTRNKFLDEKISDCDLTVRAINQLRCMNVETVEDLVKLKRTDLLRQRNMGKKTVSEIEDFLYTRNLKLKEQRKFKHYERY